MDPDDDEDGDDGDELDPEEIFRVQRRLASTSRQFSGSNWQTLGIGSLPAVQTPSQTGYVKTADGTGYVGYAVLGSTAVGIPSHASYVNASQLLQTSSSS